MTSGIEVRDGGLPRRPGARRQGHGGLKVIIAPDGGDAWAPAKPRPDETLMRALARAHRWKRLLEEDRYRSAGELAEADGVTRSFVNRLLRLITGQMRPERIDCTHFGSMTVLNGADLGQNCQYHLKSPQS
jgi:hypothetical protein